MCYISRLYMLGLFVTALLLQVPARARDVRVTDFGALADAKTLNTQAIQKAIDACHNTGGGKVYFTPGNFLTGTIVLKDGVTLFLEKGAALLGSTRIEDYSNRDPFKDGLGVDVGWALIIGVDAHHIGIEGEGIINGQGAALKQAQLLSDHRPESKRWGRRPFLLRLVRCTDIKVRGIGLLYAAAWTSHYFQCRRLRIENIHIESHGVAHNDGIDIDGCQQVRIRHCSIYSGDDALCFKTTSSKMACKDIRVSDMDLRSNQGAVKMGTESMADFRQIRIKNCYIHDTKNGGIKLLSVDGANIRNVKITGIRMQEVQTPVLIRLGSRLSVFRKDSDKQQAIGSIDKVRLKNLVAVSSDHTQLQPPSAILITGIPSHRIKQLHLRNIFITLPGGGTQADASVRVPEAEDKYPEVKTFGPTIPAYGLWVRHAEDIVLKNIGFKLKSDDLRPAFSGEDVKNILLKKGVLPAAAGAPCVIRLHQAAGVKIHNVKINGTPKQLVSFQQTDPGTIRLRRTHIPKATQLTAPEAAVAP